MSESQVQVDTSVLVFSMPAVQKIAGNGEELLNRYTAAKSDQMEPPDRMNSPAYQHSRALSPRQAAGAVL